MKAKLSVFLILVLAVSLLVVGCVTPEYTVSFDSDGGTSVSSQTVAEGGKATEPAAPTKAQFTFVGWFLGDVEYDFDTPVASDVALKAKWEALPPEYTVSFETGTDAVIPDQTVTEGAKAEKPQDPEKSGYVFVGWVVSESGEAYDFESAVVGNVSLSAKYLVDFTLADVVGSWVQKEEGEMSMTTVLTFAPSGGATMAVEAEFGGTVMAQKLELITSVEAGVLTMYPEGMEDEPAYLVMEDGALVVLEEDNMVFSKMDIASEIVGTWVGSESYEGTEIPYTVTVDSDGNVAASIDMFGTKMDLTLVSITNKIVLSYMGAQEIVLVLDDETLVGSGIMGGALTLAPYVDPSEAMSFELIAGTWTGSENFYGYDFAYEFVINSDGTGSAKYSSIYEGQSYDTPMTIKSYTIENNKLIIKYSVGDVDYDDLVYSYKSGNLVGTTPMGTTVTLTKAEPEQGGITVADLAGTWTGTESGEYGTYPYTVTINSDGTGTIALGGEYPMDMTIVSITVSGTTVTVAYQSYGSDYTMTLTYDNGTLTGIGTMYGNLTLTKSA